jgi:hypothetical protein
MLPEFSAFRSFVPHTVADNQVTAFLQAIFDQEKPRTVGDILKMLKIFPNMQKRLKTVPDLILFLAARSAVPARSLWI